MEVKVDIHNEPTSRCVRFDGEVACFTDAAYWFVAAKLGEFGVQHIPPAFFDCHGGCQLSGAGLDELVWFADTLLGSLGDYPDRWEIDTVVRGRRAFVERETLREELSRLVAIVRTAQGEGRPVASFGD
jgi:hypothetical protein